MTSFIRIYFLSVIAALVAIIIYCTLVLGAVPLADESAAPAWTPELKAALMTACMQSNTMHGVPPVIAKPFCECLCPIIETAVPEATPAAVGAFMNSQAGSALNQKCTQEVMNQLKQGPGATL